MAASKNLTREQRVQRARLAALTRWSRESPAATVAAGQAGLLDKFRRQVQEHDPEVVEPELTRRAEALRRAHMVSLAFKSSKVRSKGEKGSRLVRTPGGDQQRERESSIRARFAQIEGEGPHDHD